MFNECHIHLCDCTWLNVFHILNFCWSNTKIFLGILVVFGKYFGFTKIVKIFKKQCCLVLATWSRVNPVACPQSRAHTVSFRDSLASQCPSHKKYLENFSKSGFLGFSWLNVVTCSQVEVQSQKSYRKFCDSTHNSLAGGTSSCEKHLEKFFKIFVLSVLVTCPGDLNATWLSRENRVFCANRSVFKTFWVFPRTFVIVHCLPRFYLSQTHWVTLEKPPFVHHFNFNLQEKGMGFLILTIYFMFFALDFLICELLLSIVIYGVSGMGWFILLSLFDWVLWGLIKWCLIYLIPWMCLCFEHVIYFNLCCAMHFMLVVICLKDSFLCFWGFHRLHYA